MLTAFAAGCDGSSHRSSSVRASRGVAAACGIDGAVTALSDPTGEGAGGGGVGGVPMLMMRIGRMISTASSLGAAAAEADVSPVGGGGAVADRAPSSGGAACCAGTDGAGRGTGRGIVGVGRGTDGEACDAAAGVAAAAGIEGVFVASPSAGGGMLPVFKVGGGGGADAECGTASLGIFTVRRERRRAAPAPESGTPEGGASEG